jgi:hypothetical protein
VRYRACPVPDVEALAGADPPHTGRVEAFIAVEDHQLAHGGQRLDVEDRPKPCAIGIVGHDR